MSILSVIQKQDTPAQSKEQPLNSPLTIRDKGLIYKFAPDIKQVFNLKGSGVINLLANIYGKCYYLQDGCYAHRSTLAHETKQSKRQVYRQLAKLKSSGVIEYTTKEVTSSQVNGKTKIELSQDLIYTLGILKKTWLEFGIKHRQEARLTTGSIIKVLEHLSTKKLINRHYFTKYNSIDFVKYVTPHNIDFEKYVTPQAQKVLAKLYYIKDLHLRGAVLTYKYNKTYTYMPKKSMLKTETEQDNRLRIAQAKQKALTMLDNLIPKDKKTAVFSTIDLSNDIDIFRECDRISKEYDSTIKQLLSQLSTPVDVLAKALAKEQGVTI